MVNNVIISIKKHFHFIITMKKLVLTMMAVAMMTTAMAQNNEGQMPRGNRMNPKAMIERRTQHMVETYSLTAEQAEKVKALNEKYLGQMGRGDRGPRPEGMNRNRPERPQNAEGNRPERPQGGPRGFGRTDMTKYNEELKTILTEEQFKAYEADQAKRMQQMQERMRNRQQ